ncbi:MAG: glycerophosphodiester phosphodiesterase family protein [Bacteroidota bacterium]
MLKIGHRGAMGYAPENTTKSFELALQMGVPMIEIDVTQCASGEAVVIHDDRVDRTTNGEGYVSELSFEELRKLDAGEGELIPTLKETLNVLRGRCELNIELKSESVVEEVVRVLKEEIADGHWSTEDLIISSFDHHALRIFQDMMPDVRIAVLVGIIPLNYADIIGDLDAYAINPCIDFINALFVTHAKAKGLKVFVYTVNHPEDINRMRALGVDGIFTNYPDRL